MVKIELKILKQLSALSFATVKYLENEMNEDENNNTTATTNNNNNGGANNNNNGETNNYNNNETNIENFQATQAVIRALEDDEEDALILDALITHEVNKIYIFLYQYNIYIFIFVYCLNEGKTM